MTGSKFCAWSLVVSLGAIVLSGAVGMAPLPPVAAISTSDVAGAYGLYRHQIMIFGVLTCLSVAFFIPACCGLSIAMLRMQPRSLFLALLQVVGGVFALIGPFIAGMVATAAVARPDVAPEVVVVLNDLAVILIQLSTLSALLQGFSLAIAIFSDCTADPILPKWYAWTSIVWSVIAQGGLLASFFRTGPLAADGLIGIVLPMLALAVWMLTTFAVLLRIKPAQWADADGRGNGSSLPL